MRAAAPSQMVVLSVLVAATAAGPLSMNIFVPSMPGLQQTLDASYGAVQLTLSLFLIAFAAAQLLYGPFSDRWGRRPTLIAGLGIFIAGSLACALAPTIEILIAGRCIQAVGACSGMVLGRAIVRDLYDRDQSASMISYITMAMVAAPMLAPTIGGFLDEWFGWRSSMVFVCLVGTAVLAAVLAQLDETRPAASDSIRVSGLLLSFGGLLRKPLFLGYTFQVAFTAISFFSFLGGAPYVMVKLFGRPPSEYGLYFILAAGTYMVANFISGRTTRRWGVDRLIVIGLWISVAGALFQIALFAGGILSPLTLFGSMGLIGFGHGFSIPNGLAGAVSVDPEQAGAASGLVGFFQMGAGAVASYIVGLLMQDSALPVIIGMALGAVLSMAAFYAARQVIPRPSPTS